MTILPPPNPGSDAALALGCVCPVIDNAHGAAVAFVRRLDCRLHGDEAARSTNAGVTDPDLAAMLAERDARKRATLDALRAIGECSVGELAQAMGVTDSYGRKLIRARLVAWQAQGLVRARHERTGADWRPTVWSVVEVRGE